MTYDSTGLPPARRGVAPPLWEFVLALYARPGVEAACLRLQDEAGVDVCELLWRCWLLEQGRMAEAHPAPLAEIRRWQREVTAPLRTLRRRLKPAAMADPAIAELRRTLQRAELQAERLTLSRLEKCTPDLPLFGAPHPRNEAEKNLASVLQLQKKSHLSALKTLIAQLDPPRTPR